MYLTGYSCGNFFYYTVDHIIGTILQLSAHSQICNIMLSKVSVLYLVWPCNESSETYMKQDAYQLDGEAINNCQMKGVTHIFVVQTSTRFAFLEHTGSGKFMKIVGFFTSQML